MDWAGAHYEVDFWKNIGFWEGRFLKMIFFVKGVAVGDLGTKIAPKFLQQRFLGMIFYGFGGRWGQGVPGKLFF